MSASDIIGREREKKLLEECYNSGESELVVVYGRRRVGKTYLIQTYFGDQFTFTLTGVYDKPRNVQLSNFAMSLEEYSGQRRPVPTNWSEAFVQLKELLKTKPAEERQVVFLDEMPWLDTQKSDFLSAFECFWNGWGSTRKNIMLIVCGSATTWITDKILSDKGGLFNRATRRIYLQPFTLHETEQYLLSKGIRWSRYDIAESYMIMGGLPFYLKQMSATMTLSANIDNIFFRSNALLANEYEHLYNTLFKKARDYTTVVEALSSKAYGLTRGEIIAETKMADNGALTKILTDLINSNLVIAYSYYASAKRGTIYQLTDAYTLFYFRFIRGNYGHDEHYWSNTLDNPRRNSWRGYAFEMVCKTHVRQIRHRIGIEGVLCETSSWYSREENPRGAQIDLVIDRRDRVINLCEMKYSVSEFVIDKDYDMVLRNKIEAFRRGTKSRKALQLTMITTYGVRQNMYSGIVSSEVVLDDLFEP